MSEDGRVRLEIAFDGGQTIWAAVSVADADGLRRALASGSEAVFELESDDGAYAIPLRRVVYVKRHAKESRIGFSEGL